MKNKKIIGVIILIVAVVAIVIMTMRGGNGDVADQWNGMMGEPLDITLNFYSDWMGLLESEDRAMEMTELLNRTPLAADLKDRLAGSGVSENDMVVCHTFDRARIRPEVIYETDTTAQYIMQIPKSEIAEGYALVDLSGRDGSWQIDNITCAQGEVAPEQGEFTFDQEGSLLKDSIPAPYDSSSWHLVFQEDERIGVVPLLFSEESQCITEGNDTVACDDNYLVEAKRVHVFGQMTEIGAEVVRIEAVEAE